MWTLRCADCSSADPPSGWAATEIIMSGCAFDLTYVQRCRDCAERARVERALDREHALVGAD